MESPTAQALRADAVVTEAKALKLPALGLGTIFHTRPFQCSTSVLRRPPPAYAPTAQTLPAEVAATPSRIMSPFKSRGLGLGTCAHVVPFQCSISVLLPLLVEKPPTAQTFRGDNPATPSSSLLLPGDGAGVCIHLLPFQRRTRTFEPVPLEYWPTAQALVPEMAATPWRLLSRLPGLGLGTCAQMLPFHLTMYEAMPVWPTAQTWSSEEALTALRMLVLVSGPGGSEMLQDEPFQ